MPKNLAGPCPPVALAKHLALAVTNSQTRGPENPSSSLFLALSPTNASHPDFHLLSLLKSTGAGVSAVVLPVWHPQNDVFNPHLTRFVDNGLKSRNHDLTAF